MTATPNPPAPGTPPSGTGRVVVVAPGASPTPTVGIQEAINSLRAGGGGTVQLSAGVFVLKDTVRLAPGTRLLLQGATIQFPPTAVPGIASSNATDLTIAGSGSFVTSAPQQPGIVLIGCQRVAFDGDFAFSGWTGTTNMEAVRTLGCNGLRLAGWRTGDSSLLRSVGDSNIEVCRMSGRLAPTAKFSSRPFVHLGTSVDHPTMSNIRVHDLDFDGGGVIDVSFVRVRLDQMAGRSGTNADIRSVHCRNGLPTSILSDCLDTYGIVGCTISDIQADGCYTGLAIANTKCVATDSVATNCFGQGLVVGGAPQLGDFSDVTVTNFQARACCRGTKLGPHWVNGQILAAAESGRVDNLLFRNCVADATGSPNGFHGFSVTGATMGVCTIDGGRFIGVGGGQHLFVAPVVPRGILRQMTAPSLGR